MAGQDRSASISTRLWLLVGTIAFIYAAMLLYSIQGITAMDKELFFAVNSVLDISGNGSAVALFTDIGSVPFIIALSIILWLGGKRDLSLAILVALTVSSLVVFGMKEHFDRPRPFEELQGVTAYALAIGDSFPSGHSKGAFVVVGVLLMKARRWAPLALVLAAGVAVGRVLIGVHYPYDVIVGSAIGLLTGLLAGSLPMERYFCSIPEKKEQIVRAGRAMGAHCVAAQAMVLRSELYRRSIELARHPPTMDDIHVWKASLQDALFADDGFQWYEAKRMALSTCQNAHSAVMGSRLYQRAYELYRDPPTMEDLKTWKEKVRGALISGPPGR